MNWQPIETAPKDGSLILLGAPNGVWVGKHLPVYTSGFAPKNPWSSMLLNHDHMAERYTRPTHWMPLPAAPGDEPAAVEPDADGERYRWLRDEGRFNDFRVEQETNGWMKTHSRATLDAAIDAARSGQAAAKESP